MKVLLLVDIQKDFCPGGALAVPNGDEVVEVANRLMASGEFDLVMASLDWHTSDNVSFADNHPGKSIGDVITLRYGDKKVSQRLWPVHCVAGSEGASFHPRLDVELIDGIVCKGTSPAVDSYSAFFDNGQVQETALYKTLVEEAQKRGESTRDIDLSICGLATDYCVAATASDARTLGIDTTLIVDASRAVNVTAGDELRALRDLKNAGVRLETSHNLLRNREQVLEVERDEPLRERAVGLARGV